MTDDKPSEITQSVRGLLVSIAAVVLGIVIKGTAGGWIAGAGAIAFLYFGLSTLWALSVAGIARRRRG